ncbi:MAG: P-loop NTPase, partial [Lachnospiraceae bacterium]|nr:P-loop NTPase [Lachnospiraceae bacterium]
MEHHAPASLEAEPNAYSNIKKVIAVISGKGGVGKSLVTSLLAVLSRRKGNQTAILDADITGPSIPKTFHIDEMAKSGKDLDGEAVLFPVSTKTGIDVMSMNLLLDEQENPVIWRGPVIAA